MSDMSEIECPLRTAAIETPDLPALEAPGLQMTFRELDDWVEGAASLLRAGGRLGPVAELPPRVAMWMENDWRMVVLLLAAPRAGVVACPLSLRLPRVDEASERVSARMIISERTGTAPDRLIQRLRGGGSSAIRYSARQPVTAVFTSGSSGEPKAAVLSVGNHYYSAVGSNANIPVAPGDRWLVSLPLYHIGAIAILHRCLLARGIIVLQDSRALADAVFDATHVSLVTTQLFRLLRKDVDLSHLKAILIGGSAAPPNLIDDAHSKGYPIHTSYGMTEMASQVATTRAGASRAELSTSGRVLPHRELSIGADGEIYVRGRTRFLGYLERGALTEPFDEAGWFATGDVGYMENDLLLVQGRTDNMFVSGGENVMPEEIELLLMTRGDIRQAIVVPVQDDEFGRRPVAFIDAAEAAFDPEELRSWLAERLPRFKIPIRFFEWVNRDEPSRMKIDRAVFELEADKFMR